MRNHSRSGAQFYVRQLNLFLLSYNEITKEAEYEESGRLFSYRVSLHDGTMYDFPDRMRTGIVDHINYP